MEEANLQSGNEHMLPTRRRSSAMLQKSVIDGASTALQQLPEKPKQQVSLKEAIAVLRDSIVAALDLGYTYEEVAAMLSQQGVKISSTTLKSYLSTVQKDSPTHRTDRNGAVGAPVAAALLADTTPVVDAVVRSAEPALPAAAASVTNTGTARSDVPTPVAPLGSAEVLRPRGRKPKAKPPEKAIATRPAGPEIIAIRKRGTDPASV